MNESLYNLSSLQQYGKDKPVGMVYFTWEMCLGEKRTNECIHFQGDREAISIQRLLNWLERIPIK